MVNKGYVYILEVKDIVLPVCKIGMTTRTPRLRCDEINNSSTGDFIWSVVHFVFVDDCKKLETLVHSKLTPLRQRGREFFNLHAKDAYDALNSIINSQSEIKKIEADELITVAEVGGSLIAAPSKRKLGFKCIDSEYAELLHLFSSLLNVKGRPFGQLNKPYFGISDGNMGVQWNLSIYTDTGEIQLGVNLEGSEKTGKWLIAPFILSKPDIEKIKSKVNNSQNVFVRFSRDAWQGASRLNIKEKYLGGREFLLSELNEQSWMLILKEALSCLDEEKKGFRGRKKQQTVTLVSDGRKVVKDLSPHLTMWTPLSLDGNIADNIKKSIAELKPVYNWVISASK